MKEKTLNRADFLDTTLDRVDASVASPSGFLFSFLSETSEAANHEMKFHLAEQGQVTIPFVSTRGKLGTSRTHFLPINSVLSPDPADSSTTANGIQKDFSAALSELPRAGTQVLQINRYLQDTANSCLAEVGFEPIGEEEFHYQNLPVTYDEWFAQKEVERYNIRKGEKENLGVVFGQVELLKSYYSLYEKSFQRWIKQGTAYSVLMPYSVFESLFALAPEQIFIYIASTAEQVPVAGAIISKLQKTASYNYGCFDSEYSKLRPVNFLHARIIRDLIESRVAYYNMGFSGNLRGVQRFKENMGGVSQKTMLYKRDSSARRILSRLKQSL